MSAKDLKPVTLSVRRILDIDAHSHAACDLARAAVAVLRERPDDPGLDELRRAVEGWRVLGR